MIKENDFFAQILFFYYYYLNPNLIMSTINIIIYNIIIITY